MPGHQKKKFPSVRFLLSQSLFAEESLALLSEVSPHFSENLTEIPNKISAYFRRKKNATKKILFNPAWSKSINAEKLYSTDWALIYFIHPEYLPFSLDQKT